MSSFLPPLDPNSSPPRNTPAAEIYRKNVSPPTYWEQPSFRPLMEGAGSAGDWRPERMPLEGLDKPASSGRSAAAFRPVPHRPKPIPNPGYFQQLAGYGLGIGSLLAENVLSHPCAVLRRQCQVHPAATQYHLTPFTLAPVLYNLQQNQGLICLWKGVSSPILIRTASFALETVVSDFSGLPRSVPGEGATLTNILNHLSLKAIVMALTTPFVTVAFVETVQSSIASEASSIVDTVREGLARMWDDVFCGRDHTSRRLPLWHLLPFSVGHRLAHYILSNLAYFVVHNSVKKHVLRKKCGSGSVFDEYQPTMYATLTSHLAADALLFPLETVVHRLYLQGTRTIVDNLDTGLSVVPVGTRYEGLFHCVKSILQEEGVWGFYKGFGALVLQYLLHIAILKAIKTIFETIINIQENGRDSMEITGQPVFEPGVYRHDNN